MTFGTFFVPGPTEVRPDILEAMTRPMIPHRSAEFERIFADVQAGLRVVFDTDRPVYVTASSAMGLMEAGVRCVPQGSILALVNGAFSERFAKIAEACGHAVDRYEVPWGEAHDPGEVSARLKMGRYSAITVVHSETSTGVLNDVRAISNAAHSQGVKCLIDSVSGIGGVELHAGPWGLDYVLTGSQKAIALPPGLAFAVASREFIEDAHRAQNRGVYFDLVEIDEAAVRNQTVSTPALPLFFALERQLEAIGKEGMQARWARHEAMSAMVVQWVDATRESTGLDIRIVAAEGHRSPTVTAVAVPASISVARIVAAVAERGFILGAGYGKLKESTVRIGHMGDHSLDGLRRCLDACVDALEAILSGPRSTAPERG